MDDLHPDILLALMRAHQRELAKEATIQAPSQQTLPAPAWRRRHVLLALRDRLLALGQMLRARQKSPPLQRIPSDPQEKANRKCMASDLSRSSSPYGTP